jgi:DNA-binding LacI/PurR family transcriptional regulator
MKVIVALTSRWDCTVGKSALIVMRITQKQIAKEAGVSQTTVSMVLRDRKGFTCSPEVRARVLRATRRLNYAVPHRRTFNLGLLVPARLAESIRSNAYTYRFFHGAAERAAALNYHLLLEPYEERIWPPTAVTGRKVDGLIVQGHLAAHQALSQLSARLPVVMLNCTEETGTVASIMPDNAGGLALCVRHLFELGHRRIAYFGLPGPPVGSVHHRERYEGFLDAMRTLGLAVPPEYVRLFPVLPDGPTRLEEMTAGVAAHFARLPEPPTAVLSNGDMFILAFMRAARLNGWRIPEDVSVIGFDNIEDCLHSQPLLSSIEQPMEQMAAAAVDELVHRIEGADSANRQIRYPVTLVLRASTATAHPRR